MKKNKKRKYFSSARHSLKILECQMLFDPDFYAYRSNEGFAGSFSNISPLWFSSAQTNIADCPGWTADGVRAAAAAAVGVYLEAP